MLRIPRRWLLLCSVGFFFFVALYKSLSSSDDESDYFPSGRKTPLPPLSRWANVRQQWPVESFKTLPTGKPNAIPRIQHQFPEETVKEKKERKARQKAVKAQFAHAWNGYSTHAWMRDEVAPLSGGYRTVFGGWAATLIDSLDTLWIMGFKAEFRQAVMAVSKIDFSKPEGHEALNLFETTIRYLGGLLSAYDLSQQSVLLKKAIELGEMLYIAFDTPNRMPISRWNWTK